MKSLLIYSPAVLAVVGATAAINVVAQGPHPDLVTGGSNFIVLWALGLFAVIAVLSGVALARRSSLPPRLPGTLSLLSLVVLTFWLQRHTDIGIFLLGGDSVWVRHAASQETPEARCVASSTALQGTQYALNTVETIVLEDYKDQPQLQHDLFFALSEVAPNEGWSQRYKARSQEALGLAKSGEH